MEQLIGRKDAAKKLGVSTATLDMIRSQGLIAFVQFVENGRVYFTEAGLQEYLAKSTHHPSRVTAGRNTYRKARAL